MGEDEKIKNYLFSLLTESQKKSIGNLLKDNSKQSPKDWLEVKIECIAGLKN